VGGTGHLLWLDQELTQLPDDRKRTLITQTEQSISEWLKNVLQTLNILNIRVPNDEDLSTVAPRLNPFDFELQTANSGLWQMLGIAGLGIGAFAASYHRRRTGALA